MTWITTADIPEVLIANFPNTAEFMLAYDVRAFLMNAVYNLNSGDAQYASPDAYRKNMIRFAIEMTQNKFAIKYAPPEWDPVEAAFDVVDKCFDFLKQLPMSAVDPATVSIYDAWVAGTLKLYGGHA